ncbi:MAG: glycosyltransferase [Alphaproteobacteria bacterium]|nr:glycosyltransferase [Alphaproteobacteria bacterium]
MFPYSIVTIKRTLRAGIDRCSSLGAVLTGGRAGYGRPVVAGFHRTPSGIGESARLCHQALTHLGYAPAALDLSPRYLPHDLMALPGADVVSCDGDGPLILHVNPPELPSVIRYLGWRMVRRRCLIGYWAWELPRMPDQWRFALRLVREIWVPSRFCAEAIRPHTHKPVRIVPHPLAPFSGRPDRQGFGLPAGAFIALTVADLRSSLARKNPLGAVAAFRHAFGTSSDHRLVLKIGGVLGNEAAFAGVAAAVAGMTNVHLLAEALPDDRMASLMASVDVVVSMHRSEGFGLVIAQAMQAGKPVIASDWSGSTDFLDSDTGLPVPVRLIAVDDAQGRYLSAQGQVWADPDIDVAADCLRALAADPALAASIGARAQAHIANRLSSATYQMALGEAFHAHSSPPEAAMSTSTP